jgi:hypothetical protein
MSSENSKNMISKHRLFLLGPIVLGVILLLARIFPTEVSRAGANGTLELPFSHSVQTTPQPPEALRSPLVQEPKDPVRRKLRPLVKTIPTVLEIRSQVRANPHETPQALLAFAYVLAKRLGPALESETAAAGFLPDLQACALSDVAKTLASVRGLCLVNARKLALKFPALGPEFEELTARADSEARQLAARFE